jgi:hypothetical protein
MKVVYISSSHGRGMDSAFHSVDSTVKVMGIWRPGAKIGTLTQLVQSRIHHVLQFQPTHIIIHSGHNDVNLHPTKNPHPRKAQEVLEDIAALATALSIMVPSAMVCYSAMFPRVTSRNFTTQQATSYNERAHRMQRMAKKMGMNVISVRSLWISPRKYKGDPKWLEKWDGLHLTREGKIMVATVWLRYLHLHNL